MADVEPESEPEGVKLEPVMPPLEKKRKDRDEKGLCRICDHRKQPFEYQCGRFVYKKNKAQIRRDEDMAKYHDRMKNLTPYDAIAPPRQPVPRFPCCGGSSGVRPFTITKEVLPLLTSLCNLALDKYNADDQGAKFVFHDLVKSTWAGPFGNTYYITFQAKAANDDVTKTFQAQVWHRTRGIPESPPVVMSCSLKPQT